MMKRNAAAVCVGIALALCSPGPLRSQEHHAAAAAPAADPAIAEMVGEVSRDRLAETVEAMTSVPTRFSPTSGCRAVAASIYNYLSRMGLAVQYDEFRYSSARLAFGGAGRNVVATLAGTTVPERVLVVGAHYDSTSNDPIRRAPGADDNASGTAAVMEIARVLARHRFGSTIKFVAFDAEEQGEYGSEHLAAAAHKKREPIAAMLNLDMVAFTDGGKRPLALVPDRGGQWLADRFLETASRYGIVIRLVKRTSATWARSDQESYWAAGYPALALLEDDPQSNPYYHHTTDTADTLDMDFLTAVTRATLAVLADLAQPTAATRN